MSFKENLKSELTYQGVLVKELAARTGISKRTIDNYLREKSSLPPVDVAVKIAEALNVSVEYLVNGHEAHSEKLNSSFIKISKTYNALSPEKRFVVEETVISLVNSLSKL